MVFSPIHVGLGAETLSIGKNSIKTGQLGKFVFIYEINSFYHLSKYLLKHNAPFSEVLEIIHFSVQSFW